MSAVITLPRRSALLPDLFGAERQFAAAGLFLALSLIATLPALALDPRQFEGAPVWLKPIKFQVALSVYMLSLAFFARYLPAGLTARRWYRIYAGIVAFCVMGEMLWIGGAAMFGTGSHYNDATPVMAAIYGLMGLFAVTLTSASLVLGIAIWRNPSTGLSPALKLSIALGLVLTFALTIPVASALSASADHFVGTAITGAAVPIMGWSREVGDLRIAHFLATHALHVLPAAGLAIAAVAPGNTRAVWAVAGLFLAVVAFTFGQALMGLPLIPV